MTTPLRSEAVLLQENAELRARLEEAEETLRAIRAGEVDALVMGEEVYTLKGAETPYRLLIESMNEGAATLAPDGTILYCNGRLADMLAARAEQIIGSCLWDRVVPAQQPLARALAGGALQAGARAEVTFSAPNGPGLPVLLSLRPIHRDSEALALVATDLTERKRAEEALRQAHDTLEQRVVERTTELRQSEERYRLLFDRNPDGIFAVDTQGRFVVANPACADISGYSIAELLQKTFLELCAPDQLGRTLEYFKRGLREGKAQQLETALLRKDGRRVEVWVSGEVVTGSHQPIMQCAVKDITALKQADEALLQARERLALAQRAAHAGAWDWDIPSGKLTWSDELFELLGLSPCPAPTFELWRGVVHPEDREAAEARIRRALQEHTPLNNEYRIVRRDGEIRWLSAPGQATYDDSGQPLRMTGFCIDITARKQAEEALRESERRERERAAELATLLDAVPTPVFIVHDPDSTHMTGNRAADEFLRNPRGAEASLSAPAGTRPRHFRAVKDGRELSNAELPAQRAARGEQVRDFEFGLVFDDGTQRDAVGYGTPLQDERGRPRGAVHVLVDITERKQAEATLQGTLQRFYFMLGSMYSGVLLMTDDGRIEFINQAFCDAYGLKEAPSDLAGLASRDLLAKILPAFAQPDQAAARILEILERGQPVRAEEFAMKGGRTALRDFVPLSIQGKSRGRLWIHADITERKRAEQALRESEARMQQALRISRSFTFEWQPATDTVQRSASCAAILHLAGDEASHDTGQRYFQRVHPDDRARFVRRLGELTPAANTYTTEYRVVCNDGSVVVLEEIAQATFDAAGKLARLVGVTTDITARKQVEQALASQREELQLILDSAPAFIFYKDRENHFLRVNRAFADSMGQPKEQLEGRSLFDLYPREQAEAYWRDDQEVLASGQPKTDIVEPMQTLGGERWVQTGKVPCRDAQGNLTGVIGFALDITERKRAEADLERARNMLAEGQRIAHLGSWEYTADTQTTAWSDEQKRIYGLDPAAPSPVYAEMLRHHIHPEDAAALDKAFGEALRTGAVFENENRIVRPDGSVRFIYNKAQPYFDETGKLVRYVGATLDITERKEAEAALRESEARFRQTLESIPGMVFTTRPDGYCDYQSQQWVDFTGVPMSEHLGDGWNKLLHPEDRPPAYAAWRAAVEGRAPYDLEYRVRRHDGEYEWFKVIGRPICDAKGRIVRWFGTALNIQDLVVARSALEESEAKYRTLFENMAEEVHFWRLLRDEQGQIKTWKLVDANPPTLKSWGRQSIQEIRGKTTEEIFGPGATEHFMPVVRKIMSEGRPYSFEDYFPNLDKYFRFSSVPLGDYFITTGADVTAIKKAEERLKSSLREKEVLLKEIHHRVKNNLQVIASLVDLQAGDMEEPGLLETLADIRDRVRSMALVHEKLYQSENLARVDFADYLQSLLSYLSHSHGKPGCAIELESDLQPVALSVGKAVPCGLIVNELVSNAYKHAFRGLAKGKIRTGLGMDPNGRVWLRVGDNGVGMPPGLDWRQSRSLGLRLIQLLAGQLHASVEVRTAGGTEFEIAFEPEKPKEGA